MTVTTACGRDYRGKLCDGTVTWTRRGDDWGGECNKCRTSARAASGEQLRLEERAAAGGAT